MRQYGIITSVVLPEGCTSLIGGGEGELTMDYTEYVRNRITKLRLEKEISEYQMSLDLGQNQTYIQKISSGKAMPSMKQFLNICEYFDMTPMQFFDDRVKYPKQIQEALDEMSGLSDEDLTALIYLMKRLR